MRDFLKSYINGVIKAALVSVLLIAILLVMVVPGLALGTSIVWLLGCYGIVLTEHVFLFIYAASVAVSASIFFIMD